MRSRRPGSDSPVLGEKLANPRQTVAERRRRRAPHGAARRTTLLRGRAPAGRRRYEPGLGLLRRSGFRSKISVSTSFDETMPGSDLQIVALDDLLLLAPDRDRGNEVSPASVPSLGVEPHPDEADVRVGGAGRAESGCTSRISAPPLRRRWQIEVVESHRALVAVSRPGPDLALPNRLRVICVAAQCDLELRRP